MRKLIYYDRVIDFSPNTPGLRSLQSRKELETLISNVMSARDDLNLDKKTPVLLKVAPDLNNEELSDIADVVLNNPKVTLEFVFVITRKK